MEAVLTESQIILNTVGVFQKIAKICSRLKQSPGLSAGTTINFFQRRDSLLLLCKGITFRSHIYQPAETARFHRYF